MPAGEFAAGDVPSVNGSGPTEGMTAVAGTTNGAVPAELIAPPGPATVAAGVAPFVPVARLDDIPTGWVLKTKVGTMEIALANVDGEIHAIDNACSHAGGPLGDNRLKDGCFVECPWHNSVFDVTTGEAISGCARKPVRKLDARVEAGVVLVAPLKSPASTAG